MENRNEEMPVGFTLSMAMDEKAMSSFAGMDEAQKEQIIMKAKNVSSKSEMDRLVKTLYNKNT